MKVNELKEQLTKQIAPVYVVLGTQTQLIRQTKQAFLAVLSAEEQSLNVAEFDLEQVDIEEAIGEANTLPFLGEHKLVLVNNPHFLSGSHTKSVINQNIDAFSSYIMDPQLTTILVIFAPYSKLDQRKKITKLLKQYAEWVDAQQQAGQNLKSFILQVLQEQGFTIEPRALTSLLQRTQEDYSTVVAELEKLMLYNMHSQKITAQSVEKLVPQSLDDNIFDLIDSILQGNLQRSEQLYQQLLLLNNDPILLTAVSQSQIRLLLQVKILSKEGMASGKMAKFLQVHPYRVKLALQRVRLYDLSQLKKALLDLIEIDYQMKTGQGDKRRLFEIFMITFIMDNKKTD
ncbi:DNA polymerase III subunit delta [Bombilactobacillus folatiphilus]|uniref:DNA polymerase III subunit delta n=1 Tax=Bombilactobacillus folatiphilus TaxID=2923362 RepID=A0ABY4PAG9_9LACO|nr:DNA polymerase III subunit delta [Bombilactobacillus folatiphilus]UQS82743.1 DNA polymerase III subunit delta [Bombilactobacillus folatiphilus]